MSSSDIAFFDVETTVPTRAGQGCAILEFGAIIVCPTTLVELQSYSSLVRPSDPSFITSLSARSNGITPDHIFSAPYFSDISDTVYNLLHGRIWAGHNIRTFDCLRIREAFGLINQAPPEPKGIIDSLDLLTERFGRRAGDMEMATLATYFGLGQQTHRSLGDVRMNLEVLKNCATILFLESSFPYMFSHERNIEYPHRDIAMEEDPVPVEILSTAAVTEGCSSGGVDFMEPDDVSISDINACLVRPYRGSSRIILLHKDSALQIQFSRLRVRFGIRKKYVDYAGRPLVSFVVDVPPSLCRVLDACDYIVQTVSLDSGSSSEWRPLMTTKYGFLTARLRIPVINDDTVLYGTEIYRKESPGDEQKLVFSNFDSLLKPGVFVDAYFSLDPYDYQQSAGIRLVAKKLILHSE